MTSNSGSTATLSLSSSSHHALSLSSSSHHGPLTIEQQKNRIRDRAMMKINRAVGFLVTTVQQYWGEASTMDVSILHPKDMFNDVLEPVRDDLYRYFQEAKMRTAIMRLLRGFAILIDNPTSQSGIEDLQNALDCAEHAYLQYASTIKRIMCFEIMTACFLVLRESDAAVTSIYAQMELLFHEEDVTSSVRRLCVCLNDSDNEVMPREQKTLLDLFFSRVCGALMACGRYHCFKKYRTRFRNLFVSRVDGENDLYLLLTHNKWEKIRVLAVSNLGSVPMLKKLDSFTQPLSQCDEEEKNLYHLRNQIMLLVQGC